MSVRLIAAETDCAPVATDDALMLRASAGDRRAFEALVARHEPSLRRFCRAILRDDAAAEEAAQDAFVRLWKMRERYRPEGRCKELLFIIARNVARRVLYRRRLHALFLGGAAEEPRTTDLPRSLEVRERDVLVRAAIDRLPAAFRLPLTLRFCEEMDYGAIARVIGRTESAARSRVHYGLKALAELLPPEVRA
jgi:RNA polymerase sigma-70 factor (ECF subfamily)